MKSILVIMMLTADGHHINHIRAIDQHGYMNRSICTYIASRIRRIWEEKGAEIVYAGCPDTYRL